MSAPPERYDLDSFKNLFIFPHLHNLRLDAFISSIGAVRCNKC